MSLRWDAAGFERLAGPARWRLGGSVGSKCGRSGITLAGLLRSLVALGTISDNMHDFSVDGPGSSAAQNEANPNQAVLQSGKETWGAVRTCRKDPLCRRSRFTAARPLVLHLPNLL